MTVGSAVVAPGSSTEVTVVLKTESSAPVLGVVELHTNDPATPLAFVTVQGVAAQGIRVIPERVFVQALKHRPQVARVTVAGPENLRIAEASCLAGRVTCRLIEPEAVYGFAEWTIELALDADEAGPLQDELQIQTSLSERPLIIVPITVMVEGDLQVRPKSLFWASAGGDEATEETLTIRSRSGAAFTVIDAGALDDRIRVTPPRRTGAASWEISVLLAPNADAVIDSRVVLTTDVAGERTVEVPLYADLRAAASR